jgi:hypothetical protein
MYGNSNWALGSNFNAGWSLTSNLNWHVSTGVGNLTTECLFGNFLAPIKYTIVTHYQKALNNYKEAEKNYEKAINELNKFKTVLRDCIFNGNENFDFLVDIIFLE